MFESYGIETAAALECRRWGGADTHENGIGGMFTGIIEGLGTLAAIRGAGQGKRLAIEADFSLAGSRVGDSISVSGACLTAVAIAERRFEADVAPETLRKTTLGGHRVGDRVNLERALRLSDRIDGHLVSGHIDGTGEILDRQRQGNAVVITVGVSEDLSRLLILKGSVAVDGISLTVNALAAGRFAVSIIPHTSAVTTIVLKEKGQPVNIETDLIGKYVFKFLSLQPGSSAASAQGVTMDLLAKAGYVR